jgi:hypothetical protein
MVTGTCKRWQVHTRHLHIWKCSIGQLLVDWLFFMDLGHTGV